MIGFMADRSDRPRRVRGGSVSTHDASTGIEWIDRQECLRLLGNDEIGRLAVLDGGTPVIFPVNYGLDGSNIVFRTDPGTKLDDGPRSRACFEIDRFDRGSRSGWSVVAVGRLEEITRYDSAHERVQSLPVHPWAEGQKAHWMRLVPDRITGRRLRPAGEQP
jgi:nitroimidazol reductase NimA-like FMN-containing flavoprotein (pyridoxamine 5'-phosphate oxidase superfamily)